MEKNKEKCVSLGCCEPKKECKSKQVQKDELEKCKKDLKKELEVIEEKIEEISKSKS
jgi:hypothetical protein